MDTELQFDGVVDERHPQHIPRELTNRTRSLFKTLPLTTGVNPVCLLAK